MLYPGASEPVADALHAYRCHEVLMQVIDILDNAILPSSPTPRESQTPRDEPHDPTCGHIGTWNYAALRIIARSASTPAARQLSIWHTSTRTGLQKLLAHHVAIAVLRSRHAPWRHDAPDTRMAQHVIRVGQLLHPPRGKLRERALDRSLLRSYTPDTPRVSAARSARPGLLCNT